jgi:hypothetical protein
VTRKSASNYGYLHANQPDLIAKLTYTEAKLKAAKPDLAGGDRQTPQGKALSNSDNGTQSDRARENNVSRYQQIKLDHLFADRPDLFARVQAGTMSATAACIAAGWEVRKIGDSMENPYRARGRVIPEFGPRRCKGASLPRAFDFWLKLERICERAWDRKDRAIRNEHRVPVIRSSFTQENITPLTSPRSLTPRPVPDRGMELPSRPPMTLHSHRARRDSPSC